MEVIRIGPQAHRGRLDRRVDGALALLRAAARRTRRSGWRSCWPGPTSITSPTWQNTSLGSPRSDLQPERAQDRQRHREDDHERQREALVLRRQHQEHEDEAQARR